MEEEEEEEEEEAVEGEEVGGAHRREEGDGVGFLRVPTEGADEADVIAGVAGVADEMALLAVGVCGLRLSAVVALQRRLPIEVHEWGAADHAVAEVLA